jgi:DNA topoisomerase-1
MKNTPITGMPPHAVRKAARSAGLLYVSDAEPGIRRIPRGKGFVYVNPNGLRVRGNRQLQRIVHLVIPPAWTDVWICRRTRGHLQATGRDARGRKQHLYHPDWRAIRDRNKFNRLAEFGRCLPRIRRSVSKDLRKTGLPREKITALVVRLLDQTHLRVGNEEYAKSNHSYGLTTLHNRHVRVRGSSIHFQFRGKSGIDHAVNIDNPRLARLVKKCQDLPGQELFNYLNEQERIGTVSSSDVNDYLQEQTGESFTAKDFRTWAGTLLAAQALAAHATPSSATAAQAAIRVAVAVTATKLGNTRAICRKCYIHPGILDAFLQGKFASAFPAQDAKRSTSRNVGLSTWEKALMQFLKRLEREKTRPAP